MKCLKCIPTTNKSDKRKVLDNLKKDACVYFKVKNILVMFEYGCEIKPKSDRENLSLPFESR